MIANYHTHTIRCEHAVGTDREYVENAIAAGLKILGFSDHTAQAFPKEYAFRGRMSMDMLEGYVNAVNALKREYAKDITIHVGLEAEFYPDFFDGLLERVKEYGIEYLILGQHYLGNEIGEVCLVIPREDPQIIPRYCAQVKEALETGAFTYLAHPDVVPDMGQTALYEREMREVCRTANRCGVPLELNLLGIRDGRHYPNGLFWEIAAQEQCQVIFGTDAHDPKDICRPEDVQRALEWAEKYQLQVIDTLELRNPVKKMI